MCLIYIMGTPLNLMLYDLGRKFKLSGWFSRVDWWQLGFTWEYRLSYIVVLLIRGAISLPCCLVFLMTLPQFIEAILLILNMILLMVIDFRRVGVSQYWELFQAVIGGLFLLLVAIIPMWLVVSLAEMALLQIHHNYMTNTILLITGVCLGGPSIFTWLSGRFLYTRWPCLLELRGIVWYISVGISVA
jgi:hypothetical protein